MLSGFTWRVAYLFSFFAWVTVCWFGPVYAADLPTSAESAYERAVIAFNQSNFEKSQTLLAEVFKIAPNATPALELKALNQKALGLDSDAMKTYGELVRTGPVSQKPKYYFEVGSLLHKSKRYAQARPYFNAALSGNFNVGASHFFLGLIDYEDKQYESAERHFVAVIDSEASDLYGLAYFYLGVVYYRMGYTIGAIRGMRYARTAVEPWKNSSDAGQRKSGEDITDTARKILKAVDQVTWFGNISLVTQYDSNVTLLADSITSAAQTSGKRSVKEILTGGGGFMTSPARMFQGVVSYRTFLNYNMNPDTKSFDFFSHLPAVYLNYKPYLRFTPGLKVEGNYTFQNQAGAGGSLEFHPYSLTAEMGPYARYEVNPHFIVQADAFYKPKKYYGDPLTGNDIRSGGGSIFRGTVEYTSPWKLLQPTMYLSHETDGATGFNWSFTSWGAGFNNSMRFSAINAMVFGVDVSFPHYELRLPVREDTYIGLHVAWMHELTRHFSTVCNAMYVNNGSSGTPNTTGQATPSVFQYTRFYGGLGLNYTF